MLSFREEPFDFNKALDVIEGIESESLATRLHQAEYADFDAVEYERRYARLTTLMQLEEIDVVLMTQEENIRYFTGYLSVLWVSKFRPYIAIVSADASCDPALIIPTQERGNARATSWITDVSPFPAQEPPMPYVAAKLRSVGARRAGIELGFGQRLGMNQQQLAELIGLVPDIEFVDSTPLCQAVRMLKSDAEIAAIERACTISQAGVAAGWEALSSGIGERQLLAIIAERMFAEGAEVGTKPSFFSCASGERFAALELANALGSDYTLRDGDYVFLDGGACYRGYTCDFIRQACVGQPRVHQREWSEAVVEANEVAIAAVAPGVPAHIVYEAAVTAFEERGLGHFNYLNIIGHGVGLDIHELPWLGANGVFTAETTLREGMVLSIEPGLIAREQDVEGDYPRGTYIVEDMVTVTNRGSRNLTSNLSKSLWVAQ